MAFDPPLGSTSPAVLLDNATRLDELVNGPAGTVTDRAGQPLDTWRLMLQTFAAIVENTRENLVLWENNIQTCRKPRRILQTFLMVR